MPTRRRLPELCAWETRPSVPFLFFFLFVRLGTMPQIRSAAPSTQRPAAPRKLMCTPACLPAATCACRWQEQGVLALAWLLFAGEKGQTWLMNMEPDRPGPFVLHQKGVRRAYGGLGVRAAGSAHLSACFV